MGTFEQNGFAGTGAAELRSPLRAGYPDLFRLRDQCARLGLDLTEILAGEGRDESVRRRIQTVRHCLVAGQQITRDPSGHVAPKLVDTRVEVAHVRALNAHARCDHSKQIFQFDGARAVVPVHHAAYREAAVLVYECQRRVKIFAAVVVEIDVDTIGCGCCELSSRVPGAL